MTNSMIPYSFTPGTKTKAQEVNANFIALADQIDANNETALHAESNATISGSMTFTQPIKSSATVTVTQGNLTITNLADEGITDGVIAINSDTNTRCGSLRFRNGNGFNDICLTAASESGDIVSMGIRNTDGTTYGYCPTWTNYSDSSTRIVTTAYMANHWVTSNATTSSTASKARPAVVVTNYRSGTSWYRVWSDGWIEQGGYNTTVNATTTVTLIKAFTTTTYNIQTCIKSSEASRKGNSSHSVIPVTQNTNSFTTAVWDVNDPPYAGFYWVAKGY